MIQLQQSTISRISHLAQQEHRIFEGQLLAMADLYERTYKIKPSQIARPKGRPPKIKVDQPIKQEKLEKKVKRTRKGHAITQETREKISHANTGKPRPKSDATRKKISYAMKLSHAKRRLAKMKELYKNSDPVGAGESASE